MFTNLRERGRARERGEEIERKTSICCLPDVPQLGMGPAS